MHSLQNRTAWVAKVATASVNELALHIVAIRCGTNDQILSKGLRLAIESLMFDAPAGKWFIMTKQALNRAL